MSHVDGIQDSHIPNKGSHNAARTERGDPHRRPRYNRAGRRYIGALIKPLDRGDYLAKVAEMIAEREREGLS